VRAGCNGNSSGKPWGAASAWVIFSEELRVHLRSRWYVIFTVLVVLLLILAMLLVPALQDGEEAPGAPSSEEDFSWLGFLDESGLFGDLQWDKGPVAYSSPAAGLQAVAAGKIDSFYVIPADYLESGKVEQYAQFQGRFPSNPRGEATFRSLLVHGLIAERLDPSVTTRILAPAEYENFRVEDDGTLGELTPLAQEVGGLLVPMLFAALLGTGLAVGFSYMMQSVAEEKESRLVEVVVTSASPLSIMGGKLLALVTVGLIQAAVWVIVAALTVPVMLSGVTGGADLSISGGLWATIMVCFIVGYLLTATLAIFVAAVAPSTREAGRLGGWIPVLGFAPFWFSGLLMMSPDGLAGELLSYIPLFAPTGVLLRVSAGGDMAAWQITAALAGVAVLSLIVLWISARVFRAAILMRGQSFTRHNLWAALRDAY
jgi:ABC-2 type transport system permease protein